MDEFLNNIGFVAVIDDYNTKEYYCECSDNELAQSKMLHSIQYIY